MRPNLAGPGTWNHRPNTNSGINSGMKAIPSKALEEIAPSPFTLPVRSIPPPNLAVCGIYGDVFLHLFGIVADYEVDVKFHQNERYSLFTLYTEVALKFALVCSHWEKNIFGKPASSFWKMISIRFRWPELSRLKLKVRNWYQFTKTRVVLQQSALLDSDSIIDVSVAENCHKLILDEDETEWSLKCPKLFEKMQLTDDDNVRFCGGCQEHVYLVKDIESMNAHAVAGHCVAFYTSKRKEVASKLAHEGIQGLAVIWKSKEEYDESGPSIVGRKCF